MNGPTAGPSCFLYTFIRLGAQGSGPSVQVRTINQIIQELLMICVLETLMTEGSSFYGPDEDLLRLLVLSEVPFLTHIVVYRQTVNPNVCLFCGGPLAVSFVSIR